MACAKLCLGLACLARLIAPAASTGSFLVQRTRMHGSSESALGRPVHKTYKKNLLMWATQHSVESKSGLAQKFAHRSMAETDDSQQASLFMRTSAHPDHDLASTFYTWPMPNKGVGRAISDHVGLRIAGPLTFLHALQVAKRSPPVLKGLSQASARGRLRLHIIGVNSGIEPHMAWAGILKGWSDSTGQSRLAEEAEPLMGAWGLNHAFKGLGLDLLFVGYRDLDKGLCAEVVAKEGSRAGWNEKDVSMECAEGSYEQVLRDLGKEPADFVVALNAGFGIEPSHWRDTIAHLLQQEVPTLVTNYGRVSSEKLLTSDIQVLDYLGGNILAQTAYNPFFWVDGLDSIFTRVQNSSAALNNEAVAGAVVSNGEAIFFCGEKQPQPATMMSSLELWRHMVASMLDGIKVKLASVLDEKCLHEIEDARNNVLASALESDCSVCNPGFVQDYVSKYILKKTSCPGYALLINVHIKNS